MLSAYLLCGFDKVGIFRYIRRQVKFLNFLLFTLCSYTEFINFAAQTIDFPPLLCYNNPATKLNIFLLTLKVGDFWRLLHNFGRDTSSQNYKQVYVKSLCNLA